MFRFFENMPEEITVKVFSYTSFQDQARLAQVNKDFNRLASDKSLKLFRSENLIVYRVGNMHFVVKKENEKNYLLFTAQEGQKVSNSRMYINQEIFDRIVEKAKEGASSLIKELKTYGTSRINSRALELEQNRITNNDLLESFRSNPENLVFQIGNTSLLVEKIAKEDYELITIPDGQIASMMTLCGVKKTVFDQLVEKAKESTCSLIEELNKWGGVSALEHVCALKKAYANRNHK